MVTDNDDPMEPWRHDGMALCCEAILNSPAVSDWLRRTLASALDRDPVDAAADAEILLAVLRERCDAALFASELVADLLDALQEELRRADDGP